MEDTLVNIDGKWCRLYVSGGPASLTADANVTTPMWVIETSETALEVCEWRPGQNLGIIKAAAIGAVRGAKLRDSES